MNKLIRSMTAEELTAFVTVRRERRLLTPKKKHKGKLTVTSLSQALNIPEEKIIAHLLKEEK